MLDPGQVYSRRTRQLWIVAVALGGLYLIAFLVAGAARLGFPYHTAWLESEISQMVQQLSLGESIYVAPTLNYIPNMYTPLYYQASHLVSSLFPSGSDSFHFMGLRLVALLATLGQVVALVVVLRRRQASWLVALVFSSMFIAAYGRFEFWYDTARPDTLVALLLFVALALMVEGKGYRSALAAGIVAGLAVLSKQVSAPLLVVVGLYVIVARKELGRMLLAGAIAGATMVVFLWATGDLTNPWFYYFTVTTARNKDMEPFRALLGLRYLAVVFPFLVGWSVVPMIRRFKGVRLDAWEATALLILPLVLLMRVQEGASNNHFIPLLPILIVAAHQAITRSEPRRCTRQTLLAATCALQLAILVYNPATPIPTRVDVEEGARVVETLRAIDGPIYLPTFAAYAVMAGKPWTAGYTVTCDLIKTDPTFAGKLDSAIAGQTFGAVIPRADTLGLPLACNLPGLDAQYREASRIEFHAPFFHWVHRRKVVGVYVPKAKKG